MIGMDDQRALDQLDGLIAKGEAVPERADGQQWMSGGRRVEPQPFAEWRSQSLAFARSILRDNHAYLLELERVTEPTITNNNQDPQTDQRESGVGVLRAIREDVANGYLSDFRSLIAAEVFTDFLDMAEHLLGAGYHHAAASLAGAVLEDSLRRELTARGAKATGNLESMNQIALDQEVYGPPVFKQVKVWIDIRNDADHGNWDRVEAERVESMVRDVPGFLARDLGMAG
jgi:hypothetical protein